MLHVASSYPNEAAENVARGRDDVAHDDGDASSRPMRLRVRSIGAPTTR